MFAELLALVFATAPDVPVEIVEIASTVAAGIAACEKHQPDVVLLDLGLPDGSGIAVAEHVAASLPDTRVIVVSRQASTFVCPPHLAACVNGVVSTADPFDALQVMLAGVFTSPGGSGSGASLPTGKRRSRNLLTRREREVMAMVGQRLSSREIAQRVGVSLHTINALRKNIARKLGVPGATLAFVAYDYQKQRARPR